MNFFIERPNLLGDSSAFCGWCALPVADTESEFLAIGSFRTDCTGRVAGAGRVYGGPQMLWALPGQWAPHLSMKALGHCDVDIRKEDHGRLELCGQHI